MQYTICHFEGAVESMRKEDRGFCLVEAGEFLFCDVLFPALYPMHETRTLKDCPRVKHESVIALTIPEMQAVLRGVEVEEMFSVPYGHYRS